LKIQNYSSLFNCSTSKNEGIHQTLALGIPSNEKVYRQMAILVSEEYSLRFMHGISLKNTVGVFMPSMGSRLQMNSIESLSSDLVAIEV
jgi:hypothetical protein